MKPLQVITVAYNRPDFIALQYHSLCRYLKGPWILKVFSDALVDHEDNDHKIKNSCKKLHVQHIRVPPYIQTVPGPSPRAGNALDWALKNYAYNYDGLTLVMDSDMFLVQSFDPIEFMRDTKSGKFYDMAGVVQTMSHSGYWFRYLWMALLVINGTSIKHKNPEQIRFMNAVPVDNLPTDAGGPMHYYLENHPDLRIKPLKHMWSGTWSLPDIVELGFDEKEPFCQYLKKEKDDPEIAGIGEMISNYFYHYRAGSNWNQLTPAVVDRRARHLEEYMLNILPILKTDPIASRPWRFYTELDMNNDEIEAFRSQGLANGFMKNQLEIYVDNFPDQVSEPLEMVFIDLNSSTLPSLRALEELFLIHETLHNENVLLSLDLDDKDRIQSLSDRGKNQERYDSNLTYEITHRKDAIKSRPKNYLLYRRPGMQYDPHAAPVYAIDPQLLKNILNNTVGNSMQDSREQITTELKRFEIKKQHQYQIIVIGKKLEPTVSVQLVCVGDTFFGALNAKEFSLGLDLTLIKWDFYNKFETKIDIGLEVRDNRALKNTDVSSTYEIRRAYLSCIGPLG